MQYLSLHTAGYIFSSYKQKKICEVWGPRQRTIKTKQKNSKSVERGRVETILSLDSKVAHITKHARPLHETPENNIRITRAPYSLYYPFKDNGGKAGAERKW